MSLVAHAEEELRRAGLFDKNSDYGGLLGAAVLELVKKFADQGHSGFSAESTISIFETVARFKPLTPLTGEDDEWEKVDEQLFQNKRCSRVFKDLDGSAYDIKGKIFREPDGVCFTNGDSCTPVTFPYTPHTEYVDAPATFNN